MVQFNFPTIIRFGAGAVTELADYLKSKDIKHPLLVTDPIIATLDFTHALIRDVQQKEFPSPFFMISIRIPSNLMCSKVAMPLMQINVMPSLV